MAKPLLGRPIIKASAPPTSTAKPATAPARAPRPIVRASSKPAVAPAPAPAPASAPAPKKTIGGFLGDVFNKGVAAVKSVFDRDPLPPKPASVPKLTGPTTISQDNRQRVYTPADFSSPEIVPAKLNLTSPANNADPKKGKIDKWILDTVNTFFNTGAAAVAHLASRAANINAVEPTAPGSIVKKPVNDTPLKRSVAMGSAGFAALPLVMPSWLIGSAAIESAAKSPIKAIAKPAQAVENALGAFSGFTREKTGQGVDVAPLKDDTKQVIRGFVQEAVDTAVQVLAFHYGGKVAGKAVSGTLEATGLRAPKGKPVAEIRPETAAIRDQFKETVTNAIKDKIIEKQQAGVEVTPKVAKEIIEQTKVDLTKQAESAKVEAQPKAEPLLPVEKPGEIQSFVSPSIKEGLTFDTAIKEVSTPRHAEMKSKFEANAAEVGVKGKYEDIAGAWSDGAENSIVFKGKGTLADVITLTAKNAKVAEQKQGIYFKRGKGPDALYEVTLADKSIDPKKVYEVLQKNDIPFQSVGLGESQGKFMLFNKSGEYFDTKIQTKLKSAIDELGGAEVIKKKGNGDFIGSFAEGEIARVEAQTIYDNLINQYARPKESGGPGGGSPRLQSGGRGRRGDNLDNGQQSASVPKGSSAPKSINNASTGKSVPTFTPESTGAVKTPRKLAERIAQDQTLSPEVRKVGAEDPGKITITHKETAAYAKEVVNADPAKGVSMLDDKKVSDYLKADLAAELVSHFEKIGDTDSAIRVAEKAIELSSDAGRNLNAWKAWSRLSPETIVAYAKKIAKQTNEKAHIWNKTMEVTKEMAVELTTKFKEMQSLPDGPAKTAMTREILGHIESLKRTSGLRAISTIQSLAMLLNPKTIVRNVVGNELYWRAEGFTKRLAATADWARVTAARSVGIKAVRYVSSAGRGGLEGGAMKRMFQGSIDAGIGLKQGTIEGALGHADMKKFDTFNRTFKSKFNPLTYLEKVMNIALKAPDEAAYQRAYKSSLREQAWVIAENQRLEGLITKAERLEVAQRVMKELDETMSKAADEYGQKVTFQDKNPISVALIWTKKALNFGKEFGIGDFVTKFAQTPGALIARALEYSPAGILKSAWELYPLLKKNGKVNVHELQMSTARAFVGTAGLTGLGYLLAKQGIITGRGSKDKDENAFQKYTGNGQYRVNYSALRRYIFSGFGVLDKDAHKARDGDNIYSYDWAQPLAVSISLGANLADKKNRNPIALGKTAFDAYLETTDAAVSSANTITEQSLFQGIKRLFSNSNGIIAGAGDVLANIPASFVPTISGQARNITDPYTRETYDPNPLKQSINLAKNKIPGLNESLPIKYDTLGNKQKVMDSNTVFNVFFNPGFQSKLKKDQVASLVLDLIEKTGSNTHLPRVSAKKFTFDGATVQLTNEEFATAQKFLGEKTSEMFGYLANKPSFINSKPEDQQKELADRLGDINSDLRTFFKVKLIQQYKEEGNEKEARKLLDAMGPKDYRDYLRMWRSGIE